MSYVLVLNKNKKDPLNKNLKSYLCPYDSEVVHKVVSEIDLYFNDFSAYLVDNEGAKLKTPSTHCSEANSAWSTVQFLASEVIIKTDPLSQCPLWYANTKDKIVIGLEKKSMQFFIGLDHIQRLSQGSLLRLNLNSKTITSENENKIPWINFQVNQALSLNEAQLKLSHVLMSSAAAIPRSETASFLSGGIDSSVATALFKKNITCSYNLTTHLGDEKKQSEETSKFLSIPCRSIKLAQDEIDSNLKSVVSANELTDGLTAEILLQLNKLVQHTREAQIITGYGADLLFGGMLRHKAYLEATGTHDTASLLSRTHWSQEFSPFYYWQYRKRMFHLFWHPDVIAMALTIPADLQFDGAVEKIVLRSMAVKLNLLTHDLAYRPKLGMTNGTQVNAMLSNSLGLSSENEYAKKTSEVMKQFKGIFFE